MIYQTSTFTSEYQHDKANAAKHNWMGKHPVEQYRFAYKGNEGNELYAKILDFIDCEITFHLEESETISLKLLWIQPYITQSKDPRTQQDRVDISLVKRPQFALVTDITHRVLLLPLSVLQEVSINKKNYAYQDSMLHVALKYHL